jgi:hypothetical protein
VPAVIQTKTIKPGRLRIDAVRKEVQAEMLKQGKYIQAEYRRTVATWTHKPKFETVTDITGGDMTILVGTDDEIYLFVDEGTKAHPITPKANNPRGLLFFQEGYVAKTVPRVLGSRAGGRFGAVVAAKAVRHPGTEARGFSQMIQEKTRKRYQRDMLKAVQRGAKKAEAEMARGTVTGG